MTRLTRNDYPIAEKHPERVRGQTGRRLDDITLEAVEAGEVDMRDLRITPEALRMQAEIARAAGRPTLAENFERAAEMVAIPREEIFRVYELLRPGRARDRAALAEVADRLRRDHKAETLAAFVEEAAEVYERRGLYRFRF